MTGTGVTQFSPVKLEFTLLNPELTLVESFLENTRSWSAGFSKKPSYQDQHCFQHCFSWTGKCGSRGGGQGIRTPPPPGKSQFIWVSIGNKQLDPPPPGKSWTSLQKVGLPLEPWKMIDLSEPIFDRLTWTPLTKIPGSAHDRIKFGISVVHKIFSFGYAYMFKWIQRLYADINYRINSIYYNYKRIKWKQA